MKRNIGQSLRPLPVAPIPSKEEFVSDYHKVSRQVFRRVSNYFGAGRELEFIDGKCTWWDGRTRFGHISKDRLDALHYYISSYHWGLWQIHRHGDET